MRYIVLGAVLLMVTGAFAQTATVVKPFDKIIVNPHIQATFVQGDEESVCVENSTVEKALP